MHAFERATGVERCLLAHPEQSGGLHQQEGPQPLAAAEHGIAHGLRQGAGPGGRRGLRAAEQSFEPRLNQPAHAFELFGEFHLGDRANEGRLFAANRC